MSDDFDPSVSISGERPLRVAVRAYSSVAQVGAVALQMVAVTNLAYLVEHIVYDFVDGTQTAPPLAVALGLALFSGVPWLAVALVRRWVSGTLDVDGAHWVLGLRRARIEIPRAALGSIRPFALPLPEPGLVLTTSSGRRFRLAVDDAGAVLGQLGSLADGRAQAVTVSGGATVAYADAKRGHARPRAWLLAAKWLVLPLALAVILFRLDQYIVFGGAFGQYYAFGLGAYLRSFGTYWAGTTAYLVIYASVVRLCVEPLALLVTSIAPGRARPVRRIAESVCWLAYFGLVPAYVAFRLLF
ncbi:hypothetical protein [Pendulispora albinea]|uniref:Uncharacterized protein n=1 Tax=Pendulispora albinea TaxID=2741071 RepID=A0ABZ2LYS7_9BACT